MGMGPPISLTRKRQEIAQVRSYGYEMGYSTKHQDADLQTRMVSWVGKRMLRDPGYKSVVGSRTEEVDWP